MFSYGVRGGGGVSAFGVKNEDARTRGGLGDDEEVGDEVAEVVVVNVGDGELGGGAGVFEPPENIGSKGFVFKEFHEGNFELGVYGDSGVVLNGTRGKGEVGSMGPHCIHEVGDEPGVGLGPVNEGGTGIGFRGDVVNVLLECGSNVVAKRLMAP